MTTQTLGSDSGTIDSGSGSWSVTNGATISGITLRPTGSSVVSILTNMRVLFTLSFPVKANPVIKFSWPTEITIENSTLSAYIGGGLFGSSGSTFSNVNSSYFQITGSSSNTSASTTSFVTIQQIRNPNKVKTTGSLGLSIYNANGYLIASVTSGVTIPSTSLTSGSSGIVSISSNNYVVQSTGVSYTFTFKPGKV